MSLSSCEHAALGSLFNPKSIAVVGASSNPAKIGGLPVEYLLNRQYPGAIYPVNPNQERIQGLQAYPTLRDIGAPIDMAICAVPASGVMSTVEDAAAAGVGSIVMFSSGFAETGADGVRAQNNLRALVKDSAIRLLGPNCLGFVNNHQNVYATFSPALKIAAPLRGNIGLISQSGAFGIFALMLAQRRGLGISHFVSTGNEADIELADALAWQALDPATSVILCYLEGARDGQKLCAALELARAQRKPVVMCKVGRTTQGAAAAASHTASLAGRDEIYDAVLRQYGVYRAQDVHELFDIGYACSVAPLPESDALGIVSISGGAGVLMVDEADRLGLSVPPLAEAGRQAILKRVPFASAVNPVDITGQVLNEPALLGDAVDTMLEHGHYGAMVSFQAVTGISPQHRPLVTELWARVRAAHPALTVAVVSLFDEQNRDFLESHRCLTFEEPAAAVRAIAALHAFRRHFERQAAPIALPDPVAIDRRRFDEADALRLLADAGIPVVSSRVARTADEAASEAAALGFPVVLKVLSADIAHKSDVGGVALRLADSQAVRVAFARITESASRAVPHAHIEGVLVAPMIQDGVECILGVTRDPVFGPVVMFGLGGILVEVLKDVTFRQAPFDVAEAHRMIREIRAWPVLGGVRGQPAVDVDALAETLATLSRFAAANAGSIESIDINPFIARPKGQFSCAVDALVVSQVSTALDLEAHA
ncbi:acetate--CoA ligase family protein [Paraburkholderia sp. IW21]|uniref:acetate--CoA ligase family protein n=1 Tax=Paraburkholderia sp. IW21 TaxID=3242488 RepID=UPI00352064CF